MKAVCTQENLRYALYTLERVVGKQSTLPILGNILIETKQNQLILSATNLEIGVVTTIGAKIEREGRITIPAKLLNAFIQNLSGNNTVDLDLDKLKLTLSSGRYQVRINGLDAKDFPLTPEYHGSYPFQLPAQQFKEALQKVLFSISMNESRVELTGVFIQFFEHFITLAASDSFRLAEYTLATNNHSNSPLSSEEIQKAQFLIPASTLQEISRIIRPETQVVSFISQENQLFFDIDGVRVVSRLLNGRYPDYQQIIPKTFGSSVIIKKDEILHALKMSQAFSVYGNNEISLSFKKDQLSVVVSAQTSEIGENQTTLEIQGGVDADMNIIFNPRFLVEGITSFDGEGVKFSWNTSTTPVLITEMEGAGHYLYLVMPIKK